MAKTVEIMTYQECPHRLRIPTGRETQGRYDDGSYGRWLEPEVEMQCIWFHEPKVSCCTTDGSDFPDWCPLDDAEEG